MTTTTDTSIEILKQDSLGRVRTPRARQEAILGEFDRSGMSGQQFAQYLGINYQTFATWVQKRRKRQRAVSSVPHAPALQWVEAEVGTSAERDQPDACLVVELGRGAVLRVGDEKEAKLAAALLGYLGVGPC
jgi:hypothetical protein